MPLSDIFSSYITVVPFRASVLTKVVWSAPQVLIHLILNYFLYIEFSPFNCIHSFIVLCKVCRFSLCKVVYCLQPFEINR